jgi:hypothetical protein
MESLMKKELKWMIVPERQDLQGFGKCRLSNTSLIVERYGENGQRYVALTYSERSRGALPLKYSLKYSVWVIYRQDRQPYLVFIRNPLLEKTVEASI